MLYQIFKIQQVELGHLKKRKKFVELITKYKVVALEDNPYGELRYEGEFFTFIKIF